MPDSEYPEWIWEARGPCRAVLRRVRALKREAANERMSKMIRNHNRERIRHNNQALKGASQ